MPPILFTLRRTVLAANATPLGVPPSLCGIIPLPTVAKTLSGVSRDSTGAPLAGCTCTLFRVVTNGATAQFVQTDVTVSDGSGNYSFVVGADGPYRVTFDLDGAPIRAGLTLKTLAGA